MNLKSSTARQSQEQNLTQSSETWFQLMRNGKFEEAWRLSDQVLRSGLNRDYHRLPRHLQSIWDGTPLHQKRVLIRCYHGLGDTIQFIRYVPLVKEIASEVIVWAQSRLIPVLKHTQGIDQLLPLHDGTPEADYDADVEIMELAHVFRTTVSTIPFKMPYINIKPLRLSRDKNKLAVGLVWKAGDWDQSRSVPFELLQSLFKIKGTILYILQDNAESAGWSKDFGIHPGKCTLYQHARIIKGLDLMISIDSMPVHLAGALNVPVWLMLQKNADWRWMENITYSPWYPSMKIFRQKEQNNWVPLLEQINNELQNLVQQKIFHP